MKAAIVNPYLDTLGGGERYTLAFADVLAKNEYEVEIQWPDEKIKKKLEERFGQKLDPNINFAADVKRGDGYDVCFWVSDGSIPTLRARKNILHFQVPFHRVGGKSLLNKMKLFRIDKIVCNSCFTKKVIDSEYGVESVVIYPPVDVAKIKPKRKENLILVASRFSSLMQSKHQDKLIEAFKKMGLHNWKLILAGGTEVGATQFVKKLEKMAKGLAVEIIKSPRFVQLKELYGRAKIFWSASGFGENEKKNPEKVEHFGITVVEAMAAGAVPVVFAAGGHKEIVDESLLWKSLPELREKTKRLIANPKVLREYSKIVRDSAQRFSYDRFNKEVMAIL